MLFRHLRKVYTDLCVSIVEENSWHMVLISNEYIVDRYE